MEKLPPPYESDIKSKERNSNLELYRIIVMLLIVAHHYVVNSGLVSIIDSAPYNADSVFYYLFGMWGKTGINCFVMITGWFMCKSRITLRKYLKLIFEVIFYNVVINAIFAISGYASFSLIDWFWILWPVHNIASDFVTCFLLFYLCIPFLNILIRHLDKKMHQWLILLMLFIYTIMGTSYKYQVSMNYVSWFSVLFLIASYLRFYNTTYKGKELKWGVMTVISMIVSMTTVVAIPYVSVWIGKPIPYHFFVADSNHLMAVITAVCSFMYFKDVKLKNSRIINTIAASTFGVLLIHANSNTMRKWLWQDILDNEGQYGTSTFVLHAVGSVVVVFVVCIIIDYIRIRIIENISLNGLILKEFIK